MKIVMITTNDPAGVGIQFARAINRYTVHTCRLVTTEVRYNFMFPKDLHVPWLGSLDELERVLAEADLFHFHMGADEDLPLGPFRARQFLNGHPVVHHHHGEAAFRADPEGFRRRELALGRRAIVSTPDLRRGYPEAAWVPNPVPIDEELYRPTAKHANGHVRVGHSPTKVDIKNTDDFVEAMAGLPVEPEIIRDTPHEECLRRKRTCDLFFDHMQGYFGVSSLEALSQGVPTLAGLDAGCERAVREETGATWLPWVVVRTRGELRRTVTRLAAEPEEREALAEVSRDWMERFWHPRRIAEKLAAFYESPA